MKTGLISTLVIFILSIYTILIYNVCQCSVYIVYVAITTGVATGWILMIYIIWVIYQYYKAPYILGGNPVDGPRLVLRGHESDV